jgi:hypothetical protein
VITQVDVQTRKLAASRGEEEKKTQARKYEEGVKKHKR